MLNKGIGLSLSSILLAQALKIPIKKYQTGVWDVSMIGASGGMPSSHSAGVSSLAAYVGLTKGVSSIEFGIATVFGIIVMYDAQGIRRQTGEITIKVNTLDEEIEKLAGLPDKGFHDLTEQKLKEMLGHQPAEVLAGALLGVTIGLVGYLFGEK